MYKQEKTIKFSIVGDDDCNAVEEFVHEHRNCPKGILGSNFQYIFMPTKYGVIITVQCNCGQYLRFE